MPPRFPDTWRVDPAANYWRVRRRSSRLRQPRAVAALLARLRRRGRGRALHDAGAPDRG